MNAVALPEEFGKSRDAQNKKLFSTRNTNWRIALPYIPYEIFKLRQGELDNLVRYSLPRQAV